MSSLINVAYRRYRRDFKQVALTAPSIVKWQYLFVATAALPLVATVALGPDLTRSGLLLVGALVLVGATTTAGLLQWERSWSRWAILIAVADAIGVLCLYIPTPGAGFSMLLTLPVVWVAIAFGGSVTTVIAVLTVGALWGAYGLQVQLTSAQSFHAGIPSTTSVSSLIVLGALAAYQTNRTASARLRLLHRQSEGFSRALERTSVQERFISSVLDALDVAVLSFTADGELRSANRSAWLLLRHVGAARLDPTLAAYAVDRRSSVFASDGPLGRALLGETVDRETAWFGGTLPIAVEITSRFLSADDDGVETIVVIARDVTREREAASERDRLVTSVSHEFRAPLTSILGYVELALAEPDLPALPREMLEIALKNTERLLALSNDFLAARTGENTGGTMRLHTEPCRPAAILDDAIAALRPEAIGRSVSISVGRLHDITLSADPLRLRQVIDNVLTNAVKYHVDGGRIAVDTEVTDDNCYVIVVRDNGRGMTRQETERAFDRGFRAVSARSSAVGGSGLGLDISRQIVLAHGGSMALDSEVGVGTTVTIGLPMTPQKEDD